MPPLTRPSVQAWAGDPYSLKATLVELPCNDSTVCSGPVSRKTCK